MKNTNNLRVILLTLMIFIAVGGITNYSIFNDQDGTSENRDKSHLTRLKTSAGYTESFIHVDGSIPGNWTATTAYPWCYIDNGKYVIENVTIDASTSPMGSGIFIYNSKDEYFIIRNCTVFNAGSDTHDGGIKLENTNNGILENNNCSHNARSGILLDNYCINNTILGNNVNNNDVDGIKLATKCHNNIISGNNASNTITSNQDNGITLIGKCYNNTISGNSAHNGPFSFGIVLRGNSYNNAIEGNDVRYNNYGIRLNNNCSNNIISSNMADDNNLYGIVLSDYSHNNTILGNKASNSEYNGILLLDDCDNNIISGNTASKTKQGSGAGITIHTNCDSNTISGNIISNNDNYGIQIEQNCHNNTILGNTVSYNDDGIILTNNCDDTIIRANLIKNNRDYGIDIISANCENSLIYQNSFIENNLKHANDNGADNHWNVSEIGNYWDNHTSPDSNNDAIVDIPYIWIMGSAGSKDYFPLVENPDPIHLGEKVHIDDSGVNGWDWSKTARYKVWCTGSGTYSDPYIIDGLKIDAGESGNSILIENSKVYFIIKNCKFYNSTYGSYPNYGVGIKLSNANNGTLLNNNCSNYYYGIFLGDNCINNTILGNTLNKNYIGLCLYTNCDINSISANILNYCHYGINLYTNCDNNIISGNTIINSDYHGILLSSNYNAKLSGNNMENCGVNILGSYAQVSSHVIYSNNTVNRKFLYYYVDETNLDVNDFTDAGQVILINCNDSVILNLNVSRAGIGIYMYQCNNNKIFGNLANNNYEGIYLYNDCDNNIISKNSVNNNYANGIRLYEDCDNNVISENNASDNNYGIRLLYDCDNNTISGNSVNHTLHESIAIYSSEHNTISKNIANNGEYGIYLVDNSDDNTISGNLINNNSYTGIRITRCDDNCISRNTVNNNRYGIFLYDDSDRTNITENYISFNEIWAIYIYYYSSSIDYCYDTVIKRNVFVSSSASFINDEGVNTTIEYNYFSMTLPSLNIDIVSQSFLLSKFLISFNISSETGLELWEHTVHIWWNGMVVSGSNITELENGLYNVSLTPIFVVQGEDPILLNFTVLAANHLIKYFETSISVEVPEPPEAPEPCEVSKFLQVELIEHSYSLELFNFTFSVFNETNHGINSATIQMWWNETDVSDAVVNLGNGIYFVSLEPITVAPGEVPVLLSMIISADGYEDKQFETYLAVDPDTLEKGVEQGEAEFPFLILIIALISVAGGIGATIITIGILRKRRPTKEII